mmetsp:Transcript_12236/g.20455  ORF Transcript_12236/g.20455 Transcript_12236/m.20455 type:complete len:219 (+) Transcript_12236:1316-1972(+)
MYTSATIFMKCCLFDATAAVTRAVREQELGNQAIEAIMRSICIVISPAIALLVMLLVQVPEILLARILAIVVVVVVVRVITAGVLRRRRLRGRHHFQSHLLLLPVVVQVIQVLVVIVMVVVVITTTTTRPPVLAVRAVLFKMQKLNCIIFGLKLRPLLVLVLVLGWRLQSWRLSYRKTVPVVMVEEPVIVVVMVRMKSQSQQQLHQLSLSTLVDHCML